MRNKERSKIDTLSSKLKELEEEDQKNARAIRRQEITNSISDHSAIKLELRIKKINSETHNFMETEQLTLEC